MWSVRLIRTSLAVSVSRLHTTQLRFSVPYEQPTTAEWKREGSLVMRDKGEDNSVAVKLMVPYYTMGAIIGTGGERIKQLKTELNTSILYSGNNNFPGTHERVFYIHGTEDDVAKVVEELSDTLRNKDPPEGVSWGMKRQTQMKLVLPDTFCNKLLADKGTIISKLSEEHCVQLHIERVKGKIGESEKYMTITEEEGDEKKVLDAAKAIIRMSNEDPEITITESLTYSHQDTVEQDDQETEITIDSHVAVKVMVPYYTMGAIIGRGGERHKQLKSEFNTSIFNSGNNNFPGTNERVFYIRGAEDDVVKVVEELSDTIRNKDPPEGVSWGMRRQKQMKLVLPDTFCSKILADKGTIINELKEEHGVRLHIERAKGKIGESEKYMMITEEEDDEKKMLDAAKAIIRMSNEDPEITISERLTYSHQDTVEQDDQVTF